MEEKNAHYLPRDGVLTSKSSGGRMGRTGEPAKPIVVKPCEEFAQLQGELSKKLQTTDLRARSIKERGKNQKDRKQTSTCAIWSSTVSKEQQEKGQTRSAKRKVAVPIIRNNTLIIIKIENG